MVDVEDGVEWSYADEGDYLLLSIKLSNAVSKSDLKIQALPDTITVAIKDQPRPLFHVLQFFGIINSSEVTWELDGTNLTITLPKVELGIPWPSFTPVKSAIEEESPSAGDAFAARGKIEALFKAAQDDDIEFFKGAALQFTEGDIAHIKDGRGRTCLHFAAQSGSLQICQYLVQDLGCSLEAKDEDDDAPLSLAAGAGQAAVVEYLLEQGADISTSSTGKVQPIHRAAAVSAATTKTLLDHGADPSASSDAGTPLLWASGSGNEEVVMLLLERGVDPNVAGGENVTPLLVACAAGNKEIVDILLQHKANPQVNAAGAVSPLHAAAEASDDESQLDLVKLLLQAGADPNAKDKEGHAPIEAAASAGNKAMVALLLDKTTPLPAVDWTVDGLIKRAAQQSSSGAGPSNQMIVVPEPELPDKQLAAQYKRKGDEAFVRQQYAEAAQHYSDAIRHDTQNHLIWANRSAAHLRLDSNEDALLDAQRARALDPSYAKAWYREGCACRSLGLYEEAAQAFFEGHRLEPNNKDMVEGFRDAIALGQAAYQAKQKAGQATH